MDNGRSGQRGHNASTTSIRSIHASIGAVSGGGAYGTPAEPANGAGPDGNGGLVFGVGKEVIQQRLAVDAPPSRRGRVPTKRSGFLQAPIERTRAQIKPIRPGQGTGFDEAARKETGIAQGHGHFGSRVDKGSEVIRAPGAIGEPKQQLRAVPWFDCDQLNHCRLRGFGSGGARYRLHVPAVFAANFVQ